MPPAGEGNRRMGIYRVRLRVERGVALVADLDALVAFRTGNAR
ncbi:MAG: hypothetical protein ABWX87_06260 [Pseudoxanthomonas sp.]